MLEPPATIGLGFRSAAIHDIRHDSLCGRDGVERAKTMVGEVCERTFSPNVTCRAGRLESSLDSGSLLSFGRPDMGQGMSPASKPESNMTTLKYFRAFFPVSDVIMTLRLLCYSLRTCRVMPEVCWIVESSLPAV